jgi:hypothetical protein
MSSDDIRPRPECGFRYAGPGLAYTFRCAKCNQPIRNYGRRLQLVNGVKQYVGQCCATKGAKAQGAQK